MWSDFLIIEYLCMAEIELVKLKEELANSNIGKRIAECEDRVRHWQQIYNDYKIMKSAYV